MTGRTSMLRTTCPVCRRNVARRRDGTTTSLYPPPDRRDLACGDGDGRHCRGSHNEAGGQ